MLPSREATAEEIEKTGLIHRVYLPREHGTTESGPRPMVFMVHGRSGNAAVMWFFGKAFSAGAPIIVSPQAPDADPEGGFSWWETPAREAGPDVRSREEKFRDASRVAEILERFVLAAIELYGGDRDSLVAAGFSQGSGVSSTLSLLKPTLFRGVAILSGFIPKAVMDSPELLPDSRQGVTGQGLTHYLVVHGTKDEIIPVSRADNTVQWLSDRGLKVQKHYDEVTHKVGTQGLRVLTQWYQDFGSMKG